MRVWGLVLVVELVFSQELRFGVWISNQISDDFALDLGRTVWGDEDVPKSFGNCWGCGDYWGNAGFEFESFFK